MPIFFREGHREGHLKVDYPCYVNRALLDWRQFQTESRPVFPLPDGSPYPPDKLSRDWGNAVRDKKLPRVMFHARRHSHASALIAGGVDIVTVSQRLGHGSPAITLTVNAHAFNKTDTSAALAIEAALAPRT